MTQYIGNQKITYEIQQIKGSAKGAKGMTASAVPPSIADTTLTEDDSRSLTSASMQSESGIHASQIKTPSAAAAAGEDSQQDGAVPKVSTKTKRQLWDDLTISGMD